MQPAKIIKHLQDILEKENILAEVDALAMIARAADGSMRDALSITDQAIMLSGSDAVSAAIVQAMLGLSNRDALFEVFESIFQGKVDQAIKTLHTIYENGGDPLLIAQDLIHILYWVICLKNAPSLSKDMAWPEADRQKGQQLATLLPTSVLLQSWDLMQKSYDDVRSSYQPSQALDVALMRLAFVKDVLANPSATSGGHNVQSSSVTSSVSRASMPQTFEAMADLLLYAKEGLLHGHILHDVHLISYAPGHLVCGLGGRARPSRPDRAPAVHGGGGG
jgi:DNA polymerase-3 subunit gamma/tau